MKKYRKFFIFLMITGVFLMGCDKPEELHTPYEIKKIDTPTDRLEKMCIEGHEYYYLESTNQLALAPHLTALGRPVTCKLQPVNK